MIQARLHNVDTATLAYFTERQVGLAAAGVAERLWARVDRSAGCWEWRGSMTPQGYGQMGVGSRKDGGFRPLYVHRLAWILTHGAIPPGQSVLHHCDNPPCCNPAHLFLGTQVDNMRDAASKGRLSVRRPSRHKVSTSQLGEIDALLASGVKQCEIAKRYDVTDAWVSQYARGQRRQYDRPSSRLQRKAS